MRIAIGADHAGFILKDHLRARLAEAGHELADFGPHSSESVDYPDYAELVAHAAVCIDLYSAELCRQHNDANVLTLGSRIVALPLAEAILDRFLATPFEGGRHARRVAKLDGDRA